MSRFWVTSNPDGAKWDAAYRYAAEPFPYDRIEYLDSLGVTWCAIEGDSFILPFAVGRSKLGYPQAFCPLGAQRLGPIGDLAGDAESLRSALDALPRYLRLRLRFSRPQSWPEDRSWHWRRGGWERWRSEPNYELRLGTSYEVLYRGFSSQTRKNLKSSFENQLWEYSNPEELWNYFAQNQGTKYRVPAGYEQSMKSAMYHLLHQGRGAVWAAIGPGNQWLAGMFVAFSGNRAVLLFSAVTEEGRERQSMTWLINEFLTMAVGRWSVVDFEGSSAPGLARFYQGFGAENVAYLSWERWNLPWPLR
ncbi:MAG: hypothetical protein ACKOBQ_00955 [Bacteroidota bacterium]